MGDFEFVNPSTGAVLGPHAFGAVATGTSSATFPARLRYKHGQSGSGVPANALVVVVSDDGGATWRTDTRLVTVAITEVGNATNDPLYTERIRSLGTASRLPLAPFRAGCYVDLSFVVTPDLRPGAAQTDYRWKAGVDLEQWQEIALVPDAPTGILTGLGDTSVTEWVTAPTLTNGTDKVMLGDGNLVYRGVYLRSAAGDVALSQDDADSATLASGEEYVAVGAVYTDGSIIVTKGSKATAGAALAPLPYTDAAVFTARVPYGGVIVTSTLLAVSGRCLVADAGGLVVTVQPGRAVSPGMLALPATVQSVTLPDDETSTVYLSPTGTANLVEGAPLATVVTSGGDITSVTDARRILRGQPVRLMLAGDETVAANLARAYIPFAWTCDRVAVRARVAAAGGATGDTWLVIKHDAPSDVANAYITAGDTSSDPTVTATSGAAGWITVDIAGVTSGGTPAADLEVLMWIVQTA